MTVDDELPPGELDRLLAGVDLVRRAGAGDIEFGRLDDTPRMEDARWWATASYRGTKVTVDEHASPFDAVEALALRILRGGQCAWCGNAVTLDGMPDDVVGVTLADGSTRGVCRWRRDGQRWDRTCTATARTINAADPGSVLAAAGEWTRQLDGATAIRSTAGPSDSSHVWQRPPIATPANRAARRRNAKRNRRRR